jgi:hypothetical protein
MESLRYCSYRVRLGNENMASATLLAPSDGKKQPCRLAAEAFDERYP